MIRFRNNFTAATKRDAWERCCDAAGAPRCERCNLKLGPANTFYQSRDDGEFDHDQPDAMLGEPTLENCMVLCRTCHKRKTKIDIREIAKSNRVRDRAWGIKKPRSFTAWRRLNGAIRFASRER